MNHLEYHQRLYDAFEALVDYVNKLEEPHKMRECVDILNVLYTHANLIALAPELLEALESAIETAQRLTDYEEKAWACLSDITDLQSIVNKAKGGQP